MEATATLTRSARDFDPNETLRQIGTMNVLAISGGRATIVDEGLMLPVSNGYHVRITLAASDLYTVERLFIRAGKVTVKGRAEGIDCEQIGETAYRAGMFHDEWPGGAL